MGRYRLTKLAQQAVAQVTPAAEAEVSLSRALRGGSL